MSRRRWFRGNLQTVAQSLIAALLFGGALSCGDDTGGGTTGSLKGSIKDKKGAVVGDALVKAGTLSAKATFSGEYTLAGLPAGAVSVTVSADWFQDKQAQGTVPAGGAGTLDVQLDERPLQLDPADKTLVDAYSKSFDWTKADLYMAVMPAPTRRHLDNAIYFHNPALFRDTSAVVPVTPPTLPSIEGGAAKGFDFPVGGAGGEQALVATRIVDTFALTGLPAALEADYLLFTPMLNWLSGSKRQLDAATLNKLRAVGSAVSLQAWGGNSPKPQQIDTVYLNGNDLWVKIIFEPFVKLGAGISDSDGDGRKEVFAKVDPKHYPASVLELLQSGYVEPRLGTLELKAEVSEALNELYSSTNLKIVKTIGQPYEAAGQGTIKYPFVIHEQSGQKGKVMGVILVGP